MHGGSWAELVTVPEDDSVASKPGTLDFAQAGAAPLSAITALAAFDALALTKGEIVLVVGAPAEWAASSSSLPPTQART